MDSTGSGLRISVSPCEHSNGKSISKAAQELTEHLSNYTVTCGYYSTGPSLLMLHFTHLWALFPSAQSGLRLPFPVHPPTLRPSARPPVAAHCVEVHVGRTDFFSLLSLMITEPMSAAIWTEVGIGVDKKNQLDVTFCILYFSSNSCSTCFGHPCAHHQKLTTAWCYSIVLVCAVAAGRLSRPVGR